jgi:hypothetical protein
MAAVTPLRARSAQTTIGHCSVPTAAARTIAPSRGTTAAAAATAKRAPNARDGSRSAVAAEAAE